MCNIALFWWERIRKQVFWVKIFQMEAERDVVCLCLKTTHTKTHLMVLAIKKKYFK